jgi:hypothetical protein
MQQNATSTNDGSAQDHPAVDVETTGPETLSLRIDEEKVELTKTYPEMEYEEGG